MRQTTLGADLRLDKRGQPSSADALVKLLDLEEEIAFYGVIPHGNVLKCIWELLMRCSSHVPVTSNDQGVTFVACDSPSGRLIHIVIQKEDMLAYRFNRVHGLRYSIDSNSLHAVFNQLKRKDVVVLYATVSGRFGSGLYIRKLHHCILRLRFHGLPTPWLLGTTLVGLPGGLLRPAAPHQTLHHLGAVPFPDRRQWLLPCLRPVRGQNTTEYVVPSGYLTSGVLVPSNILQRILREYKTLSKRIIVTGNDKYIHLQTDARVSLHRSDNLFGTVPMPGCTPGTRTAATPEPREDDITVELSINTLSRILKVTQFHPHVRIVCESGQPVLLKTPIGRYGSHVDVYIQNDGGGKT
jgi:hypothetical protein